MEGTILEDFARIVAEAERLVVLTGAGISKESGIPTFRDALDGLWARYDPMQLATPQAFARDPKLVWDWYQYRRGLIGQANPNSGHHALVQLEDLLPRVIIVTQNVDGFHDLVGSTDVICLHGNIQRNKCVANCQGNPTHVDVDQLTWDEDDGPPRCPHCQSAYVRPDVVWFNESLPQAEFHRAQRICQAADVLLVVGTSGIVVPAAYLPHITAQAGGVVLEVNPNPSGVSQLAKYRLEGPSGEMLPQVVENIRQLKRD